MLKGERKGICDSVYIAPGHSRQILCEWEIYPLPMDNLQSLCYNGEKKLPAFFRGSFKADKKEDCFIDMTNFKKGFVTVNGFTLGRYWEVGPHLSLYLPGGLLKDENEIIVFEEEGFGELSVEIIDHPITNNTSAAPELIE
jgi:beta-galactosidase